MALHVRNALGTKRPPCWILISPGGVSLVGMAFANDAIAPTAAVNGVVIASLRHLEESACPSSFALHPSPFAPLIVLVFLVL